jgi:hypothetical protein
MEARHTQAMLRISLSYAAHDPDSQSLIKRPAQEAAKEPTVPEQAEV